MTRVEGDQHGGLMAKVKSLGGGNVSVSDDCRIAIGGREVTLRPHAALRLAEALIRAGVKCATKEAALSVP
jgi:hypothetical protein